MKKSLACMGAAAFAVAAGADIMRISEPDAYVQDGLVALYDGIRNAGLRPERRRMGVPRPRWAESGIQDG